MSYSAVHPSRSRKHFFPALLSALAAIGISCSTTSTSVTAPSSTKCEVSVSNSPTSTFPATGGSGSLNISTTRDCTWSVSADANWVSLGTASGQGEAVLSYSIASNPVPSARSCAITVSSERIPLNQAAAPCHFDLSRTADSTAAAGGRLSVGVTTLTGCSWSASSGASWLTIQSGQSGAATGTVTVAVAANTGAQRVGQVTIAGQAYTVTQAGATPAPRPQPPTTPAPTPTTVQVSGAIRDLSGRCPNLTFTIAGRTVTTDSSTSFSKMKCSDAKNGFDVIVTGAVTGAIAGSGTGAIHADQVKKAED